MSLLDSPASAHTPALKRFAATLRAGDEPDRALLLNLQEEDRVPESKRTAFHTALAGSKRRAWKARFNEAAPAAQRALPVPAPRPSSIGGAWWTHVALGALQKLKYVSLALHKRSRPPRRLPLARRIGQPETGADRLFWITDTDATGTTADDIRNRLGLCAMARDAQLYRIRIEVGAAPSRSLYVPSALDAGFYPAWRHPGAGHAVPWGMTRHLETDAASERELLALPDAVDALEAGYVGLVRSDAPTDYLRVRGMT